jgi:hypothetical protein
MMKFAKTVLTVAALGFGIAGCGSNGGTVRLTPQPPTNPGGAPLSYTQIERLSRPAVKEVFERFVDHQISNAAEPYNDPTLKSAIHDVTIALGRSEQTAGFLQAVLYPDQYSVDLSQSGRASYLGVESGGFTGGKYGGRDINDPIIDISLGAIFGNTAAALTAGSANPVPDDMKENNCLTTQHVPVSSRQGNTGTFPYLSLPY